MPRVTLASKQAEIDDLQKQLNAAHLEIAKLKQTPPQNPTPPPKAVSDAATVINNYIESLADKGPISQTLADRIYERADAQKVWLKALFKREDGTTEGWSFSKAKQTFVKVINRPKKSRKAMA
jgi:hypothetical protein